MSAKILFLRYCVFEKAAPIDSHWQWPGENTIDQTQSLMGKCVFSYKKVSIAYIKIRGEILSYVVVLDTYV